MVKNARFRTSDITTLMFFIAFALFLVVTSLLLLKSPGGQESSITRLLSSNTLRIGLLDSSADAATVQKQRGIKILSALSSQYGWTLEINSYSSLGSMYSALEEGGIDIVVDAVLDHLAPYKVRYSSSYAASRPRLVYFPKVSQKVTSIEDFSNNQLLVIQGSWQSHFAQNLSYIYKNMQWQEFPDFWTQEDMVFTIQSPPGGYLLITDQELQHFQSIYPDIETGVGFDAVSLAYAFQEENIALERFISTYIHAYSDAQKNTENPRPRKFLNAFLKPAQLEAFLSNVKTRFPKYVDMFVEAAEKYFVDWRLIAAVSYQESLWDKDAVSPTGVKGLMMLTRATARFMGVEDRKDPWQSIDGGTRYFLYLKKLLPNRILDPDRTWIALASYNIGPAHLEDVRVITEKHGKNPDVWLEIREFLPYIEKPEWYRQSKHGYARGWEARKYIDNIRKYYQVLISLRNETESTGEEEESEPVDTIIRHQVEGLSVILPNVISLRY